MFKRHLSNTVLTAERLGMGITDVQLLVAHARNEADHPSFKVSTLIGISSFS